MNPINQDYFNQLITIRKNIIKNWKHRNILNELKKNEIEKSIENLRSIIVKEIMLITKKGKNYLNSNEVDDSIILNKIDFGLSKYLFKTGYILKQREKEKLYEIQKLIKTNYSKTCYINDDCDIYDINYDIKSIGIIDNHFNSSFFTFPIDTNTEVIFFEINGKRVGYIRKQYSIIFDINLKNLES